MCTIRKIEPSFWLSQRSAAPSQKQITKLSELGHMEANDDVVYYHIGKRLKLEGVVENMGD